MWERPGCYHSTSKTHVERGSLNWAQFMLQWFSDSLNSLNSVKVLLYLGKTPLHAMFLKFVGIDRDWAMWIFFLSFACTYKMLEMQGCDISYVFILSTCLVGFGLWWLWTSVHHTNRLYGWISDRMCRIWTNIWQVRERGMMHKCMQSGLCYFITIFC